MNKIVKGCITGALIIGAFELGGNFGYTLGSMGKTELPVEEIFQEIKKSNKRPAWFVCDVADFIKKKES